MKRQKAQKIKSKKISLPLKKMTEREKDYVAAVLEDVNSNFKAFGEGLDFVRADVKVLKTDVGVLKENYGSMKQTLDLVRMKGNATFEEVGRMKKDIVVLKQDVGEMKGGIKHIDGRLENIEREAVSIRKEINELKAMLIQKADVEYLKKLEIRLARVEQHLKLSMV